ncbi:hypothetical protein JHL18_11555 [Clostridium sp. YIM B02505]|uniref:Uncharacterized protein n=1 Tax=Clostridium yunnanense TaxID=2800325 RepID=A0ABS1EPF7_9CLOT|nr:hypothetical protein [Clostridium yunnanense]MBK1811261.1 hypothetical protein [Clostridium yunnanense]
MDKSIDQALFTLSLYVLIIIGLTIKYLLPLLGVIVSTFVYKRKKEEMANPCFHYMS